MRLIGRWWTDKRGATAVEYGLLAALMTGIILLAFSNLASSLQMFFERIIELLAASVP